MLKELLENLRDAKTDRQKEKAYAALRRVGMDKMTADYLLKHSEEWE